MTDNELVLFISELLDKKLKPIDSKFEKIEAKLEEIETRLEKVETRLEEIQTRLEKVETRLEELETRLEELETRLEELETRVKKLELLHETDVLPRVSTIEECYISTYERYKENVEHIEAMRTDIDIIKRVLVEHSEKLKKIS